MPRMSRAVTFTLGAAVLVGAAATMESCVDSQPVYGAPVPPQDAAVDAPADVPADVVNDTGGGGVRYGAPPANDF
jgi:hypothetical protein